MEAGGLLKGGLPKWVCVGRLKLCPAAYLQVGETTQVCQNNKPPGESNTQPVTFIRVECVLKPQQDKLSGNWVMITGLLPYEVETFHSSSTQPLQSEEFW